MGALLAPGQRTVTSGLRIVGLSRELHFVNYHRVLNRARWSGRQASRLLLGLLVSRFAPAGPILLGIDDTIERRRGQRIQAKGIYRDPVRSSHSHFVKASGLRWVSLMLLTPVPWAARTWALPFLTCLAPSERYRQQYRKRHKPVLDWARQMIFQAQRWLSDRELVVVGDSAFSALEWLQALVQHNITVVTRLRLDAALYQPAPFRPPGTNGRPRKKGKRLATLRQILERKTTRWQRLTVPGWYGEGDRVIEICTRTAVWYHTGLPPMPIRWVLIRDPEKRFDPQALLCTDLTQSPLTIVSWFVRRWPVEVTFQEVRRTLGVETPRTMLQNAPSGA
jgi:DDE superfamily endonuclease